MPVPSYLSPLAWRWRRNVWCARLVSTLAEIDRHVRHPEAVPSKSRTSIEELLPFAPIRHENEKCAIILAILSGAHAADAITLVDTRACGMA
jgi:hypothetical protein